MLKMCNANVKKMLMLKQQQQQQQQTIYKWKFSLFGRDDTKQAKSLIFTAVPQVEQVPKVQKI